MAKEDFMKYVAERQAMNTRKLKQVHKALLRREGFVPCKFLLINQTSQDVKFVEIKTRRFLAIRI